MVGGLWVSGLKARNTRHRRAGGGLREGVQRTRGPVCRTRPASPMLAASGEAMGPVRCGWQAEVEQVVFG